ncbi:MAG TPA: peptidoglycan editing factor PgeF [Xanthomonadaceae bacterium]|nr:peptidoglycan editing factor PgeF [Xanthomonadaceae bacterium]
MIELRASGGGAFVPADWPAPPGVHAVATRRHGVGVSVAPYDHFNLGLRCGDDAAAVAANRATLVRLLALPASPRWLRQVHGTGVARLEDPATDAEEGEEAEADAAVTTRADTVLAVLTADCLPVALAADEGGEVALAHAGWRGLAAGVIEATVAAMRTPPAHTIAWLGPAAGPQRYEVGEEVRAAFVEHASCARSAFTGTGPGHWSCDLYALARQRLAALGITRVSGGGLCTIGAPDAFYSHRRDGVTGRMATLVWREASERG